jgi:hypothetical protein
VRDLYARLREQCFERSFLQEFILPDWWSDELADVPANRAMAEAYISRQLGFSLAELRDPGRELTMPRVLPGRFKRYKNQVNAHVEASALVAQRVASRVVEALSGSLAAFTPSGPKEIRDEILRSRPYVDLESLLDWSWKRGVVVLQLYRGPSKKKFDGLATVVDGHPVIVLASGKKSPAWLVFDLAHELGHLARGHVEADGPLVESLAEKVDEQKEEEANEFALELLTGFRQPTIPNLKLAAAHLAASAAREGPAQGIDPGVFALVYARANSRFPVAQEALKYLDLSDGGQEILAARVHAELEGTSASLSEEDERLLRVLRPVA